MKYITREGKWDVYLYHEDDGDEMIEFSDVTQAKDYLHQAFDNSASHEVLASFRQILAEDHIAVSPLSDGEILDLMAEKIVREGMALLKDPIPPGTYRPPLPPKKKEIPVITSDAPTTWIEIMLRDPAGQPIAGETFTMTTKAGVTLKRGTLDARGWARVDDISSGSCYVSFDRRSDWHPVKD